ncbi:protein EFR3 homolog B-like [Centruroides sculpturatus]|uniref:protein EFR3 homolog B-like n=1 Tax=Centruroides sculpturatus TaxID=218467 RepID=UPI000C6DC17A|nr:protein EFR3 homolog B-like [Centruroides sculpturatus]
MKVIKTRQEKASYLLPGFNKAEIPSLSDINESLLFDKATVAEVLHNTGHDTSRLLVPYVPRHIGTVGEVSVTRSISDLNSISVEVDSVSSSPGVTKKHLGEEITVESLRKMMAEPLGAQQEAEEERRLQVIERFRTAPFEDLVAKSEHETIDLQNKLNEIFGKMPPSVEVSSRPSSPHPASKEDNSCQITAPPVYAVQFPELFFF